MQDRGQTQEQQDSLEETTQNTAAVLDPQTLENLAAFLSREPDEETKVSDDQLKKSNDTTEHQRKENSHKSKSKSDSRSSSSSKSRSRSREKSQPKWIYCCSKCKKSKNRDKSCLCIVPASQRRIPLHKDGCSACKCHGCSKEDVQLDYERKKAEEAERASHFEAMRNGCCKECMKAFSVSGKACVCQVPASVRRRKIPDTGCIYCGCYGCNPEDTQKMPESPSPERNRHEASKHGKKVPTHQLRRKRSNDSFSKSSRGSPSRSDSFESPRVQEDPLDNLNNSNMGNYLRKNFNVYLPLLGFGIPQRTYSYIHGKPQPR